MARAMKCDICGKLYEKYNHITGFFKSYPNAISLVKVNYEYDEDTIVKYDLCPDCLVAIGMFIEDLKGKKDVTPEVLKRHFNLPVVESVEGE